MQTGRMELIKDRKGGTVGVHFPDVKFGNSEKFSPCPVENTDKEIWREKPGDYYSPSIHVTAFGGIGMNVGGHVVVAPIKTWHNCANLLLCVNPNKPSWMRKLAMWLLK